MNSNKSEVREEAIVHEQLFDYLVSGKAGMESIIPE